MGNNRSMYNELKSEDSLSIPQDVNRIRSLRNKVLIYKDVLLIPMIKKLMIKATVLKRKKRDMLSVKLELKFVKARLFQAIKKSRYLIKMRRFVNKKTYMNAFRILNDYKECVKEELKRQDMLRFIRSALLYEDNLDIQKSDPDNLPYLVSWRMMGRCWKC